MDVSISTGYVTILHLRFFISIVRWKMSTEATAPEDTRLVKLVSKDGESFEVPVAIASISELVKSMIQGLYSLL